MGQLAINLRIKTSLTTTTSTSNLHKSPNLLYQILIRDRPMLPEPRKLRQRQKLSQELRPEPRLRLSYKPRPLPEQKPKRKPPPKPRQQKRKRQLRPKLVPTHRELKKSELTRRR